MPSNDPIQRFQDIVDGIDRIGRFIDGMDLDAFAHSEQTTYAVKYALLTIAEAASKLGHTASELCPNIPWREIRGLANRLRHEYDAIDVVRIWLMLERDLPALRNACRSAVSALTQPSSPDQ